MKYAYKLLLMVVSFTAVSLWSCSDEPRQDEPNPRHDIELSRSEADVVASTNEFALGLLAELSNANGNFVMSPMSVAMDFGMIANGAKGQTLNELMKVLIGRSDADALSAANSMFESVLKEFPSLDKKTEVSFANGFISGSGKNLSASFVEAAKTYDMEVLAAGNDMQAAVDAWVAENTRNQIKTLPLGLDRYSDAYTFLNAMYFKGEWARKFEKAATTRRTFHGLKGNAEVSMMHDKKQYLCQIWYNGLTSVMMNYGNGAYYMQIVLPDKDMDFDDAALRLCSAQTFDHLQKGYRPTDEERENEEVFIEGGDAEIFLPKFKIESEFNLAESLKALGVKDAFDSGVADFTGIFADGQESYINEVVHKALIEVDEEGTVVAAATGVVGDMMSPLGSTVIVDRPFFFFVREQSTGAILAMGQVTDL